MTVTTSWIVAAVGAVVAVAAAAAGGALVSPNAGQVSRSRDMHRVFGAARMTAYLAFGAGAVGAVRVVPWPHLLQAAAVVVALAIVICLDAVAREAGVALLPPGHPFIRGMAALLWPFTAVSALGRLLEHALDRVFPASDDREELREQAADRLRELLDPAPAGRTTQAAALQGAFDLADTMVREVMVPRVDIVGVEVESPWSEVLDRARSSAHARLPVYQETLDHVTGVLYAKDLLTWALADAEPPGGWVTLVRQASFIPGSKTIDRQLREFRKTGTHIAIVMDEFGGTAGLVTIEDVLEEIVGDIRDERDVEEPEVDHEGNDKFWVSGRVPLSDLSELLGQEFERDDVATVGGLVYEGFDRVPRAGDSTTIGQFRVVVERMRRRRIERVYFERLPASPEGTAE
ncbi:MAG TPA: hemolysin family protein [Gemmatimonadaceae bacterium]|nr:hemolysin family protein [Gemmatimonadaceae bacterium]